jgi:uncharacterized protein
LNAEEKTTNRLRNETSPYLLSHSDNPVHWQPWDGEAFRLARELDRPVFLSIGYSSCHWCHVMEQECFMDGEVAKLMNSSFICVKVDREERPDVDNRYMRYAMAMTGSGGWPLNMVLTPSGKPFFAATYIPKEGRYGRRGMLELVPLLARAWREERERVLRSAGEITSAVHPGLPSGDARYPEPVAGCYRQLAGSFDRVNGGFGGAPKFPAFHNLMFLMRYWHHTGEGHALSMALGTLSAMRYGGVYDQLGGGIHRYATDEGWRVPHYEKMLYDQAMLSLACLEAYQASGNGLFRRTAEETLDFVLRGMTSPSGGFYSSMDADDPGGEGAYYAWSLKQLSRVLGDPEARKVARLWNIDDEGACTPRLSPPDSWIPAPEYPVPSPDPGVISSLMEHRRLRHAPAVDEKILADWNGMMSAALARAAMVLNRPDYARAARKAVAHITGNMISPDGLLLHSWKGGKPGREGFLDDYAYLIWALIELHSATFDGEYLTLALKLQAKQDSLFLADGEAVYFFASGGDPLLPETVTVETHDGAVPSGNSVTLMNLHRLSALAPDGNHGNRAAALTEALIPVAASSPASFSMLLAGMQSGPSHVHIGLSGKDTNRFLDAVRLLYLPDATLSMDPALDGAVVCGGGSCSPPAKDPEGLLELLAGH